LGALNQVSALIGWGKGGKGLTSAGWQVTLCDIKWHVSSHRGEACCKLLYIITQAMVPNIIELNSINYKI